jgi:hypothetical protein
VNFSTTGCAPSCDAPASLSSSAIGDNSATLSWSAASGASSYNVRYKESAAGSWTSATSATTSLNISSLTSCTAHEFQVQTVCSGGSSSYTASSAFTTTGCGGGGICQTYCASSGDAIDEWIHNVTMGGINNTSGTDNGYGDFMSSFSADFQQGSTYPISLTPGFASQPWDERWRVWIDFNADGDFADSGEKAYDSNSSSPNAVTGSIDIPAGATLGSTGMRVQMRFDAAPGKCSNFDFGEVEDYCINITSSTPPPSCDVPTNITAANVTVSGAVISWNAASGAVDYSVQYRVKNSGNAFTSVSSAGTSHTISGLSNATEYEYQVRTNCASSNSGWSTLAFFTTLETCDAPINISASNITTTGAAIGWDVASNAVDYSVRYRVRNTANSFTTESAASNSHTISGLSDNTEYEYQVSTNCSAGSSTWSALDFFTTIQIVGCAVPSGITLTDISNNTVKVNWGAVSGAVNYTVRYRVKDSPDAFTEKSASNNFKWLTELTRGGEYEYQIRTNCSGESSAYTALAYFATTDACDIPVNPSTGYTSNTFVKVVWDAAAGAVNYVIKFRPRGSSAAFTWKAANNPRKWLINLDVGTEYEYQVRSQCGEDHSGWSVLAFVITSGCDRPTVVSSSNVSATSAQITWSTMPEAVKYRIQYREVGTTVWTAITVLPTNKKWLLGLTPGRQYEYQVKTKCLFGWTAFSDLQTFTTASSKFGGESSNRVEIKLYPNPAREFVYVGYESGSAQTAQLRVFDIYGRMLIEQGLELTAGSDEVQIATNKFDPGHYMVQINNGSDITSGRFVIIK